MKIRKIILKRLAEFVFLMAVELGTTFLVDHLSGSCILFDIASLLVATVVFDAWAQKWDDRSNKDSEVQPKEVVKRDSIVRIRKPNSNPTNRPCHRF